ncbi:hypothetical protein EYF80_020150 [Liparis tanakae]|uniref:Uncharacterized protein n=1 Tax=Liparis tanakae TaxID=230148 RepID=A0A4Z2HVL8_9TELE|nr:hypothetical protein EYF80_020150 [Liparis tanakae]
MEVKKSWLADSDGRQLSNSTHKHGSSILKKEASLRSQITQDVDEEDCHVFAPPRRGNSWRTHCPMESG